MKKIQMNMIDDPWLFAGFLFTLLGFIFSIVEGNFTAAIWALNALGWMIVYARDKSTNK